MLFIIECPSKNTFNLFDCSFELGQDKESRFAHIILVNSGENVTLKTDVKPGELKEYIIGQIRKGRILLIEDADETFRIPTEEELEAFMQYEVGISKKEITREFIEKNFEYPFEFLENPERTEFLTERILKLFEKFQTS